MIKPYNARLSSVTWNLMLGRNFLWVAKMHGHGVQTMLETYAAWIEGSTWSVRPTVLVRGTVSGLALRLS